MRLSSYTITPADTLVVSVTLCNAGHRPATEVVQVYVRDVAASVPRPDRELKAFAKVKGLLPGGPDTTVHLSLPPRAFAFYDIDAGAWRAEPGIFEILVGASSVDLRLVAQVELVETAPRAGARGKRRSSEGTSRHARPENPAWLDDAALARRGLAYAAPDLPTPYHANCTFEEISHSSWLAYGLFLVAVRVARFGARLQGGSMGDAETAARIVSGGLRCMTLANALCMSGGSFGPKAVDVTVHLLNREWRKAARRLCGLGNS
mgnify:CR=1 FL=1